MPLDHRMIVLEDTFESLPRPRLRCENRRVTDTVRYRTTMYSEGRNTGVPVPPEIIEQLGGGKRPAVTVTVNGYSYRSTVAPRGDRFLISFSAERREESGIAGGDELDVELALDREERVVAIPDDLAAALEGAGAGDAFARLAPSHRKAHVTAVESAKAPETRQRRIDAAVAKVLQG
jgi:hypothetical protein